MKEWHVPAAAAAAEVIVQRGDLIDIFILHARHPKPNLGFDLFSQKTYLLACGEPDPHFKSFGFAGTRPIPLQDWSRLTQPTRVAGSTTLAIQPPADSTPATRRPSTASSTPARTR